LRRGRGRGTLRRWDSSSDPAAGPALLKQAVESLVRQWRTFLVADKTDLPGAAWMAKLWELSPERDYSREEVQRGLERLCAVLAALPAVHSVVSDPRPDRWQVWFHIDPAHPLAWDVLRHLTFAVNGYECANEFARFQPVWDIDQRLQGGRRASLVWTIYPEARRLDAELYAEYLRDRLPASTGDPSEWQQ
jgi:hypothetical protein